MSRANWKKVFEKRPVLSQKSTKEGLPNKPTKSRLKIMVGSGMPTGNYSPFGGVYSRLSCSRA